MRSGWLVVSSSLEYWLLIVRLSFTLITTVLSERADYGSIIYGGLGYGHATVLVYNAAFNTLAFGCGIIAMFIIDFFPRNKLVALGATLVTSCLTVEAALVANFPVGPGQNNNALRAAVAMTFCYISFAQLFLDGRHHARQSSYV